MVLGADWNKQIFGLKLEESSPPRQVLLSALLLLLCHICVLNCMEIWVRTKSILTTAFTTSNERNTTDLFFYWPSQRNLLFETSSKNKKINSYYIALFAVRKDKGMPKAAMRSVASCAQNRSWHQLLFTTSDERNTTTDLFFIDQVSETY